MKKSARSSLVLFAMLAGLWPASILPAHSVGDRLNSTESKTTLIAGFFRRRYRFNVRASRYRRGGIARGSSCPPVSSFTPITNPDDISTQASAIVHNQRAPAYAIAASRPILFVNMPELPATQGTLFIDNTDPSFPTRQRQLYKADFELSGKAGIVGFRLRAQCSATGRQRIPMETFYRL